MINLSDAQLKTYHEAGFVIVKGLLDAGRVDALRNRYEALFAGEFETGIAPDEVNWQQGRDSDGLTRQLCNAWKSDRTVAGVVLAESVGRLCAHLGDWPGARLNQDNLFWKPPGASSIGFHQDSAYEDWVAPNDMVSCWMTRPDQR